MTAATSTDLADDLTVSTTTLCELAGVTFRQVDHWTRTGLLRLARPIPGSGFARAFPVAEVDVARALATLLCLAAPPGGRGVISRARLEQILNGIRAGKRGRLKVCPGVIIDLDVLCA